MAFHCSFGGPFYEVFIWQRNVLETVSCASQRDFCSSCPNALRRLRSHALISAAPFVMIVHRWKGCKERIETLLLDGVALTRRLLDYAASVMDFRFRVGDSTP